MAPSPTPARIAGDAIPANAPIPRPASPPVIINGDDSTTVPKVYIGFVTYVAAMPAASLFFHASAISFLDKTRWGEYCDSSSFARLLGWYPVVSPIRVARSLNGVDPIVSCDGKSNRCVTAPGNPSDPRAKSVFKSCQREVF